eukprot:1188696-Prorocentrum_minimum.AAC.1
MQPERIARIACNLSAYMRAWTSTEWRAVLPFSLCTPPTKAAQHANARVRIHPIQTERSTDPPEQTFQPKSWEKTREKVSLHPLSNDRTRPERRLRAIPERGAQHSHTSRALSTRALSPSGLGAR